MADDFVNNFGLLGQVLFKKRNEREARQKLDEALSRELAKIAAQAGYEKEMVEMREKAATERTNIGESGATRRHGESLKDAAEREKRERSDALERLILNNMSARELQGAEATAALNRDEAQYNREKALKELQLKAANREATARSYNALTGLLEAGEDPTDEDRALLGLPLKGVVQPGRLPAAGAGALPTKTGRIKLPSSGGTPPKPGETPRTPNNAAPEVPVQVGPKPPTAETKFDSAGSLGTGLLNNIRGNTWGVGPDSKNMQSLVEAYLQKSAPAEPPSILDALGKELGYDQRRPAIKK